MTNIKVTPEEVKENMQDVIVRTLDDFGKPCTYVTVRMKNGFTLRESTTCVDPANYNEEIGKQICLKKIEDKVWFLLGYALQTEASAKNQTLAHTRDMMISPDLHLPDMWKDGDAEKKAGCGFEWKPNMGEVYFYLGSDLFVGKTSNDGLELDEGHFHCGNCFRTRKEAEAAAERVKKALKGGEK